MFGSGTPLKTKGIEQNLRTNQNRGGCGFDHGLARTQSIPPTLSRSVTECGCRPYKLIRIIKNISRELDEMVREADSDCDGLVNCQGEYSGVKSPVRMSSHVYGPLSRQVVRCMVNCQDD